MPDGGLYWYNIPTKRTMPGGATNTPGASSVLYWRTAMPPDSTAPCVKCGSADRHPVSNRCIPCKRANEQERWRRLHPTPRQPKYAGERTEWPCTKCGKPRGKSSGNSWCRDCNNAHSREYRRANAEQCAAGVKEWKAANRQRVRELENAASLRIKLAVFALFGSACCQCGFMDHRALQLDHINGALIKDRRAPYRAGTSLYRAILRGDAEASALQLLCANCNWIKRDTHNECNRKDG